MSDRDAAIQAFIAASPWRGAALAPLAGDASNRRYLRVSLAGKTAVLMDAPAEKGEDIRPFIRIARYLTGIGLSAPKILAEDKAQGLMLLEDLGDDLFARVVPDHPDDEFTLYACATDVLITLHDHPPPSDLMPYSVPIMVEMAGLAFEWYLRGSGEENPAARQAFLTAIHDALTTYAPDQTVLVQRDYHSENLLWRPERDGIARVGLLDFQDAMLGHPAYDLVSLLQDARRDVPPALETQMTARYIAATGTSAAAFMDAYFCLGAQRNLRILGVFARLCLRDGKAHYVDLIPRVWALLQRDLSHPPLAPLGKIIRSHLPVPTPELLKKLKDQCATIPALS